jgi:hypothetical protein
MSSDVTPAAPAKAGPALAAAEASALPEQDPPAESGAAADCRTGRVSAGMRRLPRGPQLDLAAAAAGNAPAAGLAAGMSAAAVRSSQDTAAADTGGGPGVVPDRAGAGAPRASSPFIAKAAWADLLDWTEARGC